MRKIENKTPVNMKRDCVNFHGGGCAALMDTICAKEECRFYKTARQVEAELARIRERIPDYQGYSKKSDAEY